MHIPMIEPLKQRIGEDLLLYLMVDFSSRLEKDYGISLDKIHSDSYLSSLCAHLFECYLSEMLERYQIHPLYRDEDTDIKEYYDFFDKIMNERDSRQLAFYLNYLESWIEQSRSWEEEHPISFSRFEFLP